RPLALTGVIADMAFDGNDDDLLVTLDKTPEPALKQLRRLVEQTYVAKLEEDVARSLRSLDKVALLAAWYREVGRGADALELLRKACHANPQSLPAYEAFAELLAEP